MRGKSNYTGCLVALVLCASFLIGGMVGGIIGGGLMLWAMTPPQVARAATPTSPPALTPTPTPTPSPTGTPTPFVTATATRVVAPTPSTEDVVEQVLPAVVTVVNIQARYGYFQEESDRRVVGSGIVVDERGYIVTNAHVVAATQSLRVILSGGEEVPASLITYEPGQDLAMLKIDADGLVPAAWGNSGEVRLGQPVMAIGSALGDFPNSVTMGIVSGLDRALALDEIVVYGLIQTDAAINQGNSGGPLVNLNGEVIGINTFIIREDHDRGIAQGIGFAIPASAAKMLASTWIAQNTDAIRAVSGSEAEPLSPGLLPASQPSTEQ
ncbi:MAG: S1C family serine protease [Anaerolineae bacterium]